MVVFHTAPLNKEKQEDNSANIIHSRPGIIRTHFVDYLFDPRVIKLVPGIVLTGQDSGRVMPPFQSALMIYYRVQSVPLILQSKNTIGGSCIQVPVSLLKLIKVLLFLRFDLLDDTPKLEKCIK